MESCFVLEAGTTFGMTRLRTGLRIGAANPKPKGSMYPYSIYLGLKGVPIQVL